METTTASPADQLLDALREYTDATLALEAYRQANQEVLDIFLAHECKVALKETILKQQAREQGPCANANYAVTVQYKSKRWYDVDRLITRLPWLRSQPGVIVESVNQERVLQLIKQGTVPAAEAQAVYHEEPLTPAVTIKRL